MDYTTELFERMALNAQLRAKRHEYMRARRRVIAELIAELPAGELQRRIDRELARTDAEKS